MERKNKTWFASRRTARCAGGFTLLELLVVSVLMLILSLISAQMWRYFSAQSSNLTQRSGAAQELRFALNSISQDMGGVRWALPSGLNTLMLSTRGPTGADITVIYSVSDSKLTRLDQSTGISIPIADRVTGFAVENISDTVLRISITIGSGDLARHSTLLWSRA